MDTTIKPYTISVPDEKLQRLAQKLDLATFPDELDDSGWDYGAPLADIKRLTEYWKEKYDWRHHEVKINELPNFITTIQVDGFEPLDIHFVHQRSEVENAIPLFFSHGCMLSSYFPFFPVIFDANGDPRVMLPALILSSQGLATSWK